MECEQAAPLGVWFGFSDVSSMEISPYGSASFTVARLEARKSGADVAAVQLPRRPAYLMLLGLRDEVAKLGTPLNGVLNEGCIHLRALSDVAAIFERPHDCLAFYLPETLFVEFLAATNSGSAVTLREVHGVYDDVMRSLGIALEEILSHEGDDHGLVMQHIAKAVCAHVVHCYGSVTQDEDGDGSELPLSQRQQEHAKAFMAANFSTDISLMSIASAACASARFFSERFRRSAGITPLLWLRNLRISRAKGLLISGEHPEEIVALMCGFTTVSRFRDMFAAETGVTPREWRYRYLS